METFKNTDKPVAVLGNFTDVNKLVHAAEKVRDAGYRDFDIYTPYPVHGLDKAMGVKRTILPYISFGAAMFGLANGLGLQLWTGAIDYPLNIGGKPFFAWQFAVPVTFELTILCCAIATVVGMFALCKLPRWHNNLDNDEGFRRATDDTFVVAIQSTDKRFSAEQTRHFLNGLGATDVRLVEA